MTTPKTLRERLPDILHEFQREISQKDIFFNDLPPLERRAIKNKYTDEILAQLHTELDEAVNEVRGMTDVRWIEHGRDCEEKRRPCGALPKPEHLSDLCSIEGYDRKTLADIITRLEARRDLLK